MSEDPAVEARRFAEETEFGSHPFRGWWRVPVALVAGGWALFQLLLPLPWMTLVESTFARSIHLACAVFLVYLSFPICRHLDHRRWGLLGRLGAWLCAHPTGGTAFWSLALVFGLCNPRPGPEVAFLVPWLRWSIVAVAAAMLVQNLAWALIGRRRGWVPRARLVEIVLRPFRSRWIDLVLACCAVPCVLYLTLNWEDLSERMGAFTTLDLAVGGAMLLFLLEAARRSLGPALPVIALLFVGYRLCSGENWFFEWWLKVNEDLAWTIGIQSASFERVIGHLALTTEGVFGTPLAVTTRVVFLFVLLGALMNRAGGGRFFTDIAFAALGRFRGGAAKASVLASGMTGMVSGSSIANTVTTGTFTIPLMKRSGYGGVKAGAIEVAASTNGQLMPPIMGAAAFIIMEYTQVSYVALMKAAVVPALVAYLGLIYITHLEACKLGLHGVPKHLLPRFWDTLARGVIHIVPIVVLVGLLIAEFTPEYAVAFAILVEFGVLAWKEGGEALRAGMGWMRALIDVLAGWWWGLVDGGRAMMTISVAVGVAGIVAGIVGLGIGGMIVEVVDIVAGDNVYLLLGLTAIASLLLGFGVPTTANYIIMATLTAPVIVQLGAEAGLSHDGQALLLAAHLFCFYFGILADDTPPVGLAAYAAAAISREDPIRTGIQGFVYDLRTAILPFMFIFNVELLLIGVETWYRGLFVFATAMLGMCAFANLTQGWFLTRNRWWDWPFFAVVTLLMLRPGLLDATLIAAGLRDGGAEPLADGWAQALAFACYAALAAEQWWRARLSRRTEPASIPR